MYSPVMLIKITDQNNISVYPNPVKRSTVLQINLQNLVVTKIEIVDMSGRLLYDKTEQLTGNINIPILGSWPTGQYLLRIRSDNKIMTEKISLQ